MLAVGEMASEHSQMTMEDRTRIASASLALLMLLGACATAGQALPANVVIPDKTRAKQIADMKWGMFICWSFSSFSGMEWTPTTGKTADYFKATGCDTDQWCETAKDAGMGYILFLAKHHDGFCLWDTKTTDKKVTNSPLKIDVLAKLRKSCDKYGIKLALYFSEGDWNWPGAVDGKRNGGSNPEVKRAQIKELLAGYGPIEFWWMDHAIGDGGLSHKDTVEWIHKFQPNSFVGFNHGQPAGRLCLRERGRPGPIGAKGASKYNADAESSFKGYFVAEFTYPILPPHTGGAQWFYSLPKHDQLCHPVAKIFGDYRGARKHGNIFSINVGPNYAGKLRKVDVDCLTKVGQLIRAPKKTVAKQPPPNLKKPIKVYLLSGQSNMVGFGKVSGTGTTNLEYLVHNGTKFPHLSDGDGGWSTRNDVFYISATSRHIEEYMGVETAAGLTRPAFRGRGLIGPEVQFGYLLGDYHDEMVLVLKIAQGNRSIGFDVMPPSSRIGVSKEGKFYKGWQYDDFVADAHRVLSNLKKYYPDYQGQGYEIAGFCWWQGHKDNGISQRFYEKHLVNLIKDLRKEFKAPNMNAVIATVAFGGMGMGGPYLEIAKAQMAVSDPKKYPEFRGNVASVDCRPFYRGGGAHYGGHAETYMLVGDALARAMIKLLKKEPIVYKPLESGAREKVITTGPSPDQTKPVKVYILLGQSNMVGMGAIGGGRPGCLETVARTNPKFKHLIDKNGNWVVRNDVHFVDLTNFRVAQPLTVGVPPYYDVFGPDLQFGHVLGDYHDELVLVIKAAQGNRSIGFDINPPSSRKGVPKTGTFYPGWQYDIFVGNIRKTLDNLKEYVPQYNGQGYEIAGFCWWQGHKDKGMSQDVYEYHLVNLINDLRKEFDAPKAPFSIATVGFGGENLPSNWHGVLRAQMAVSDGRKYPGFAGNVATCDTRPFWRSIAVSPKDEGHHYNRNAETYLLVGDALARNMIRMKSNKTNGTRQ